MNDGEVVFLVNPASANASTGRRWPELERRAARAGLAGETRLSEGPGHIVELARAAAGAGAGLLVVVGGDGALNECVNGVLGAEGERPEVAWVPRGTGMDFGRTYGIPRDPDAALEVARAGRTRTIDVGRVRYRRRDGSEAESYFANVSSVGLSGACAERANRTSKALGGKASFFIALVATFARWRNVEMTVEVDGERRTGTMTDVVVANGQYHGGAMWLAPEAQPDDGLFDVLLIGDVTKPDFVRSVGRIYRGTHLTHPKIELVRATVVTVDAATPMPIEVDGEQPGTTPAAYEIVPRALKIRVPRVSS